jgi:predicted NodU family carbamoyl transferase
MILNTSFNCQEPLVDTVEQARATWKRTGLDVLVTPEGVEVEKTLPYELRLTAASVTMMDRISN